MQQHNTIEDWLYICIWRCRNSTIIINIIISIIIIIIVISVRKHLGLTILVQRNLRICSVCFLTPTSSIIFYYYYEAKAFAKYSI